MYLLSRRRLLIAGASAAAVGVPSSRAFADVGGENPFISDWTYRSFVSDPDPNTPFNDLQFAVADIKLEPSPFGELSGRLSFGADFLRLKGTATYGNPFTIRFQGVGATPGTIENGQPWVYDYLGFLAPAWPNGIDQRPAIVGTIVRTVPHSQGKAKAGYVASWIAVRQDAKPPPPVNPETVLRDLETSWAVAVSTNDVDKIGRFFTDDFIFIGAGGILQTRMQHLDDFRSGRLKVDSVKISESTIHVYDSTAIASTLTAVSGKFAGRDISGTYRFLDTWVSQRKNWLAVGRQQTRVGNPT